MMQFLKSFGNLKQVKFNRDNLKSIFKNLSGQFVLSIEAANQQPNTYHYQVNISQPEK
jgi:hypothetical protein